MKKSRRKKYLWRLSSSPCSAHAPSSTSGHCLLPFLTTLLSPTQTLILFQEMEAPSTGRTRMSEAVVYDLHKVKNLCRSRQCPHRPMKITRLLFTSAGDPCLPRVIYTSPRSFYCLGAVWTMKGFQLIGMLVLLGATNSIIQLLHK